MNIFLSQLFSLEGKTAVVTGAGGYLCGEMSKALAQAGCNVVVLDLRLEKAKSIETEIKELCDANNTKLIIYQAPIYKTKVVNSNTAFTFVNHSDLLNYKNDFYNAIHVNKFGRKKVSAEFAVVLQNLLKTNP